MSEIFDDYALIYFDSDNTYTIVAYKPAICRLLENGCAEVKFGQRWYQGTVMYKGKIFF